MERIPKGIYTPEFRAEAVKLVEKDGLSVDAAAKRLSESRFRNPGQSDKCTLAP